MNEGWQRPGGPPEITFEIPLADQRPRERPHPEPAGGVRRLPVAIGAAVCVVLVGAVVLALADDGPAATPATTGPPTVPATLAPVDDEPAEARAASPGPTLPTAANGVPSIVLAEFDLQALIEYQEREATAVRGVTTVSSPSIGELQLEVVSDGTGLNQLTFDDGANVTVGIYDEITGNSLARRGDGPGWIRYPASGPSPTLLASFRYGPLRADTIGAATDIRSGSVIVVDMAGRATGPPMRVFHVTMPADVLAGSTLQHLGGLDPDAGVTVDFVVHASERLGVELVAATLLVDGEELTFRHRTEPLPEPPRITLPNADAVIDAAAT